MTKQDLINRVAEKSRLSKVEVSLVIETAIHTAKSEVIKGNSVTLRGFGTLLPVVRKAKIGRNISKGTVINVPKRTVPVFVPAKRFKTSVYNTLPKSLK